MQKRTAQLWEFSGADEQWLTNQCTHQSIVKCSQCKYTLWGAGNLKWHMKMSWQVANCWIEIQNQWAFSFHTLLWHSTALAASIVIWVSLERLLSGREYIYWVGESLWVWVLSSSLESFEGQYIEWERESICVNRLIPVAGPLLVVYWCHHWTPNISAVHASRLVASLVSVQWTFVSQVRLPGDLVTSTLGCNQLVVKEELVTVVKVVKEAEPWRSFSCLSSAAWSQLHQGTKEKVLSHSYLSKEALAFTKHKYNSKHCQKHNGRRNWLCDLDYIYQQHGTTCIGCIFGHQIAPFALVAYLATRWRHLYYLQIWPPDGATCISWQFGHQMAPLALVANLATRWRHLH